MDIKEYISSGIIEACILDLASKEERAEFERLCLHYPEIVSARNAFEESLEKEALNNAPEAPAFLRDRFLNSISPPPVISTSKVIQMEPSNPPLKRSSTVSWLAAASVILLIVSGYLTYRFYRETITLRSELQATRDEQTRLDGRLRSMEEYERMVTDPNVAVVNLTPMPKKVPASASIYWDSTSTNVFLVIKNMPQLPADKQYQLWAIIDGKTKDLGLFDVNGDKKLMLKMNNTQKADAFAITIEKRGNTGGPNLEELQIMGKTKL